MRHRNIGVSYGESLQVNIEIFATDGKARPFRTERGRAHLPDPELISVVSGLYLNGIQGEVKNGIQGEIKRASYELLILA